MKSKPAVISIIGAASTTFGPKVLRDIINHPEVEGSAFRFMDIDEEHLEIYTRLAHRINDRIDHKVVIESTTDRKEALKDADYVIITVETQRNELWKQDLAIPRKHGIRQVYGELGGPGGLFHSLRQIPVHLDIARDIEEICPNAVLMIESNPLNRICLALERYANVGQILGLCHGVEIVLAQFGERFFNVAVEEMDVTAAGTNHFTWILDLRLKATGEDLYPSLQSKLKGALDFWPLSQKLFEIYGYFPSCGDTHIGEYLPYAHEFVYVPESRFDRSDRNVEERWKYFDRLSREGADLSEHLQEEEQQEELKLTEFFKPRTWADTFAFPIIAAIQANRLQRMNAVNVVNQGTILNLPSDVFVEVPAIVDRSGVRPLHIGELPKPLAALNRRDIEQTEMIVEAAVKGDRRFVLQAMLLDPVVDSLRGAERIVDEMLKMQADYLPQFA
jgi:alpha-galactosidase